MQLVKEIVKELKVFERNKISLEMKVLGIATYIQTSFLRRITRIYSEIHSISKALVWNWIKVLGGLPISAEKKKRDL